MTNEEKEAYYDLLTEKVLYGLDAAGEEKLRALDPGNAADELFTLEMTAAAIGMAGTPSAGQMPAHLRAQVIAGSHDHVSLMDTIYNAPSPDVETVEHEPSRRLGSWFGWLGWAAAAAACIALAVNVMITRSNVSKQSPEAALQTPAPSTPSLAELRDQLAASPGVIKANWTPGNVKDLKQISGDVVWSDEKQTGYIRLRGLPINDAAATCYQLWIFDQTQDKTTPIDGGIFDVSQNGEVIIPINAKLRAVKPEMFALTIERHGGVVVSKRDKVAAIAKV